MSSPEGFSPLHPHSLWTPGRGYRESHSEAWAEGAVSAQADTWGEGRSQGELCGVHRQAFGSVVEPRRAGTVVLARTQGSGGQQKTNMPVMCSWLGE